MKPVQPLLVIVVALVGVVFAGSAFAASQTTKTSRHIQQVAITITPSSTSMAAEGVVSENFAIQPGIPVRITLVNRTHAFHNFTVKALGVSMIVGPAHGSIATKATVTFVTQRYGVFDWTCLTCPAGHAETQPMGGKVYSIIAIS